MGCAKSSEAQPPQPKPEQDKQKSHQIQNPRVNTAATIPFRNEQLKSNPHPVENSLRESDRPDWNQPHPQQNKLAVPQKPIIIDNSPVNIIYQSDPVSLPDLKNMDRLQSNQIIPHPDHKMSDIKQISQENVISNEIKKLQTVVQDPKEELRTINNTIKLHSEHLEERVKQQEIRVIETDPFNPADEEIGSQFTLPPFLLHLPRIQILPQLVQPA